MAAFFDRVADIYDATRWAGMPPEIMKKLLNTMNELLAGCRTILDIGTETGRFAEYFNDSGFNVVGIDVSLLMMARPGLRRMVPPAIVKLVGDYWTDVDVHEETDSFNRRKSSVSWGIPAEVNNRIIQQLHSENPEKTIRGREIVEVVCWDPTRLRNVTR